MEEFPKMCWALAPCILLMIPALVEGVWVKLSGPDLQITSSGNYHQRIIWDPPLTINKAAVESDVFSYLVCFSISTECIRNTKNAATAGDDDHNIRLYIPNLRAYINFNIKAVNGVGDDESANIVHEHFEHQETVPEKFSAQDLSTVVCFDTETTPTLLIEVMTIPRHFNTFLVHFEQEAGSEGPEQGEAEMIENTPVESSIPFVTDWTTVAVILQVIMGVAVLFKGDSVSSEALIRVPKKMKFYFIACLIMLGGVTTTQAEFVDIPTSFNATLNSTATFSCSTNALTGTFAWIVNGLLLPQLNTPDVTALTVGGTSFLRILAKEEYDNSTVVCELTVRDPVRSTEFSDPAFLRVQGLLDAVSNLKSENLVHAIHLTWEAPPSLDITSVDPDIWYRVDITVNGTSDIILSNYSNVPEFIYRGTNTSVIYMFRVTPINGAGNGTTSAPVTGYFIGPPRSITPYMVETSCSAKPLNVNITITYMGAIPPGEMPDGFQVHAETIDTGEKLTYHTDDIPMMPDSNGRVFIQLNRSTPTSPSGSSRLASRRRYKATITAQNIAGGTNSTGDIHFSTHDAQNCTANECSKPNTVNVSCAFPGTSVALGYLSILCFDNSSREIFVAASRDDMSNSDLNISVSGVPSDNCTVVLFDIDIPPVNDTVLAAGVENVTVTDPDSAGDEEENITVIPETKGASVIGTFKDIPKDPNGQVNLCITFDASTSGDEIVVFAHNVDDPEKLSSYHLNLKETNCTPAPALAGGYFFGVFTNGDNTLNEPDTPLAISVDIVPTTTVSPIPSTIPSGSTNAVDPTSVTVVAVAVAVPAAAVLVAVAVFVVVLVKLKGKKACMVSPYSGTCEKAPISNQRVSLIAYQPSEQNKPSRKTHRVEADCCDESKMPENYASLTLQKPLCSVPPNETSVPYSLIEHTKKANQPSGVGYADLETFPGKPRPPALDSTVQYQTVLPQPVVTDPTPPTLPPKRPVTDHLPLSQQSSANQDNLFAALHPAMTHNWKKLGESLGVDEDFIDEIYTIETDEECLKKILNVWIKKSSPTWNEVADTLRTIGENELAESLYIKYVLPGILETPPRTPSSEKLSLVAEEDLKTTRTEPPRHVPSSNQPDALPPQTHTEQKSPVMTETAFQKPCPEVNHPSLEDKVTDGKEGYPAENDDTHCALSESPVMTETAFQKPCPDVNHPSLEDNVTDGKKGYPAENDTFGEESDDIKEEEGREESHLSIPAERHAHNGLYPQSEKTEGWWKRTLPVAFPYYGEFLHCEEEYTLVQADERVDTTDPSTDSEAVQERNYRFKLLCGSVMQMEKVHVPTDFCVLPSPSATCMSVCETARINPTVGESLSCNEAATSPSGILSLTQCVCELAATCEFVFPEMESAIAVQDKAVEGHTITQYEATDLVIGATNYLRKAFFKTTKYYKRLSKIMQKKVEQNMDHTREMLKELNKAVMKYCHELEKQLTEIAIKNAFTKGVPTTGVGGVVITILKNLVKIATRPVEMTSGLRHVVEYADYKDEGKTLGTAAFKVMWGAVPGGNPPALYTSGVFLGVDL